MADTALVDNANETAKTTRDFYLDIKKFTIAVINTSLSYGAIINGLSAIGDVEFDVGQYRAEVREVKYGYDSGELVRRTFSHTKEGHSEIAMTVYRFTLFKQAKVKRVFGGEKIVYQRLLQDHFSEPEGNGPRDTTLFRWEGQDYDKEFNYFDLSDIVHIRDYLDTIKAITEGAQAYVAL